MLQPERGDRPPARRPLDEAELQQEGLEDVLDRLGLLAERDRERGQPDRAPAELVHDRAEQLAVHALEPELVDLEQVQRLSSDRLGDAPLVAHLRDVTDPAEDAVRDPWRPARAAGDLLGGVGLDLDAQDGGRAGDDRAQLRLLVVAKPERHPEAVAQRRGEQTGAGGRADQRERRQVERERARGGALAHHDVDAEVLERRVEDLLGRPAEPVDLVHEEDVVLLERREDRGDVLLLERRAGGRTDAHAELLADDVGEARLAEPGRARQQDMVERLAAGLRRLEGDLELFLDPGLADEVIQAPRPERALDLVLLRAEIGGQELRAHAAFLSARRTCSSTGSEGSTAESARSASRTDQPSSTSASRASNSPR